MFKNLEATLSQALPQEWAEWRRLYGRGIRKVTLSAVFVPFSVDILQKEDNYHLLKQPILHIFWTQCAVSNLNDDIVRMCYWNRHDDIKDKVGCIRF